MKKTIFVLLLATLLLAGCQSTNTLENKSNKPSNKELPNIVLLIGDDHGYPYFGFMGADYVETPNMDELAKSGVVFTDGYVPENHCRPSLATLVTGKLPVEYRKRLKEMMEERKITKQADKVEFDHQAMKHFETLPKMLTSKGYRSFQGGKWWEFHYENGGFSEGMTKGWTQEDKKNGSEWFKKFMGGEGLKLARATMEPVYEFIDKNKDKPMFIWYAPELPHYPFDAPDKYYNIYKDKKMTESAKRYYANCTWFDDGVGELRNYLKKVGEFDNTLFIYVNDNGWEQTPDQEFWNDPMRSHNGGDKGKSSIYDQSFRTPIVFSWKGKIGDGKRLDTLIHSADIPATILDLIGIKVPKEFYGKSYRTALEGKDFDGREEIIGDVTTTRDPKDVMGKPTEGYWLRNREWFFRWNLTKKEIALYDMKNDPNNDKNLADEKPNLVKEFKAKIEEYKKQKGISALTDDK